jgi:hypothetical protein
MSADNARRDSHAADHDGKYDRAHDRAHCAATAQSDPRTRHCRRDVQYSIYSGADCVEHHIHAPCRKVTVAAALANVESSPGSSCITPVRYGSVQWLVSHRVTGSS